MLGVYFWTLLYVASVLFANLTLNKFIDLGGFGLLSIGTIFFAAVFTLRDKLHQFGLGVAFRAISWALAVNVMVAVALGTPVRFVVASFFAILVGELADTAMYQAFIQRSWLTRALSSNAISIPLDSLIFTMLAFYGELSSADMAKIIWADLLFKTLIAGALALGLNHWFVMRAKRGL